MSLTSAHCRRADLTDAIVPNITALGTLLTQAVTVQSIVPRHIAAVSGVHRGLEETRWAATTALQGMPSSAPGVTL